MLDATGGRHGEFSFEGSNVPSVVNMTASIRWMRHLYEFQAKVGCCYQSLDST